MTPELRSAFRYRPTAQEVADALRVRRMLLDLIAGVPTVWDKEIEARTWSMRGLFIICAHDPDDEFPQKLGVITANNPVFLMYWNADDTEQRIDWHVQGAWEKQLLP